MSNFSTQLVISIVAAFLLIVMLLFTHQAFDVALSPIRSSATLTNSPNQQQKIDNCAPISLTDSVDVGNRMLQWNEVLVLVAVPQSVSDLSSYHQMLNEGGFHPHVFYLARQGQAVTGVPAASVITPSMACSTVGCRLFDALSRLFSAHSEAKWVVRLSPYLYTNTRNMISLLASLDETKPLLFGEVASARLVSSAGWAMSRAMMLKLSEHSLLSSIQNNCDEEGMLAEFASKTQVAPLLVCLFTFVFFFSNSNTIQYDCRPKDSVTLPSPFPAVVMFLVRRKQQQSTRSPLPPPPSPASQSPSPSPPPTPAPLLPLSSLLSLLFRMFCRKFPPEAPCPNLWWPIRTLLCPIRYDFLIGLD